MAHWLYGAGVTSAALALDYYWVQILRLISYYYYHRHCYCMSTFPAGLPASWGPRWCFVVPQYFTSFPITDVTTIHVSSEVRNLKSPLSSSPFRFIFISYKLSHYLLHHPHPCPGPGRSSLTWMLPWLPNRPWLTLLWTSATLLHDTATGSLKTRTYYGQQVSGTRSGSCRSL